MSDGGARQQDQPNDLHPGGIHAGVGAPLSDARTVMIMVHGRGDSAAGILGLARVFRATGMAFVAPEARGNVWYPLPFTAPPERNEPWLSSALAAVGKTVAEVEAAGVDRERIVLLGFSQGACLVSEYAARNPGVYGGVVALSGGLIGDQVDAANFAGSLEGTMAFFGCSDVDPHIPVERVRESSMAYRRLGATVVERIYPGFGHSINQDEVDWVQDLLDGLLSGAASSDS